MSGAGKMKFQCEECGALHPTPDACNKCRHEDESSDEKLLAMRRFVDEAVGLVSTAEEILKKRKDE